MVMQPWTDLINVNGTNIALATAEIVSPDCFDKASLRQAANLARALKS